MNKNNYERLGALQRIIYDFVDDAFKKGEYEISLDKKYFEDDGYVSGHLIIGGLKVRCSFNKGGYICWHCDKEIEFLIGSVPRFEKTLCDKVKAIVSDNREIVKQQRIAELKKQLKKLEG